MFIPFDSISGNPSSGKNPENEKSCTVPALFLVGKCQRQW
jgi:hypothetical protein